MYNPASNYERILPTVAAGLTRSLAELQQLHGQLCGLSGESISEVGQVYVTARQRIASATTLADAHAAFLGALGRFNAIPFAPPAPPAAEPEPAAA